MLARSRKYVIFQLFITMLLRDLFCSFHFFTPRSGSPEATRWPPSRSASRSPTCLSRLAWADDLIPSRITVAASEHDQQSAAIGGVRLGHGCRNHPFPVFASANSIDSCAFGVPFKLRRWLCFAKNYEAEWPTPRHSRLRSMRSVPVPRSAHAEVSLAHRVSDRCLFHYRLHNGTVCLAFHNRRP